MTAMRRPCPEILVLALDIGSSSTRSALFDERARLIPCTAARREYAVRYSADGGAEVAPLRLRQAVRSCLRESLSGQRSSRLSRIPIAGISASAFWHSLLGLDRSGRPLTPILTWADSRSSRDAFRMREQFDEGRIHAETGCMLRASFWPAKLRWFRRTDPRTFRKIARWVSPADWIFEDLFGPGGSSYSMASGTGLYDRRTKTWHNELCAACDLPVEVLGTISDEPRNAGSFPRLRSVRVFAPIGDGAAGNLGCGADSPGRVALNLGTSAAVRIVENERESRAPLPFGLFRYAVDHVRTVMGGAISNAGNLRRWGERELRIAASEQKVLSRREAAEDALTILPFWVAERAPTWPETLRGTILGLTQSTDAAMIFRASTCAVFYRLAEILALIEKNKDPAKDIIVSGGGTHSGATLSLLADALGRDILVSAEGEASLRGAAVNVLDKLGHRPIACPTGKTVRHDPTLADKHYERRARQAVLESILSNNIEALVSRRA